MTIAWISRPLRSLRDTLEFGDTPRQLALGIALGVVIGLVPKGNLLCVGLCLTALSTRVNLGTTMLSALVFSLLSPLADPLTHRAGLALLTWDVMQPVWDALYAVPLAAWTGFNNTVVLGNLTVGLGLLLPTYWASKLLLERSEVRSQRRTVSLPRLASYVAASGPVRFDEAEDVFRPNVAMAEAASEDELDEMAGARRRVESAHPRPGAHVLPSLPAVEAPAPAYDR